MTDAVVIVVGAGPVGLLAALLVARQGTEVLLLEKTERRHLESRAVGIMPPSLEILQGIGLVDSFVREGVVVRTAEARGRKVTLGRLDFSALGGDFPFVLSLPQDRTEALLEDAVHNCPSIRFLRGHRVTECLEANDVVTAAGECSGRAFRFTAAYLLACDGGRSMVRPAIGIPLDGAAEGRSFIMGDFTDTSGWGQEAVFCLTPRGSVESFPLPGGRRRYVLRTPVLYREFPPAIFREELRRRAGVDVAGIHRSWESTYRIRSYLARPFCAGRVFLCGDAAHLMSPVGGQNMNLGFADAEMAAWLAGLLIGRRISASEACELYDRTRRGAARAAGRRARILTAAGTSGGPVRSAARNALAALILGRARQERLTRFFSMYTLPSCNLARSRPLIEGEWLPGDRQEC